MEQVDTFDLDLSGDVLFIGATPLLSVRSPPPGMSPMFSTPLSAMSGSTRGSGGLATPIYCRAASDWCGGVIGDSGRARFCCCTPQDCSTVAHAKIKVASKSDHVYMQGPKPGQAQQDPCVPFHLLRVPLDKFLEMQKALDVMTAHFVHLMQSRATPTS